MSDRNEQRALTLLGLIDADARESVLAALPNELRGELSNRIRQGGLRTVSARGVQQLIAEFEELIQLAIKVGGPRLKVHDPDDELATDEPTYQLSGDTNRDLERMNVDQLAGALDDEHPRTAALLLNSLSTFRAAAVLKQLSPTQRKAVARELASNPQAPPVILQKIASTTVLRASQMPAKKQPKIDPIIRMADVFREIDKSDRREMLDSIRESNSEVALELNRVMYRFEDVLDLDDRQVQEVLSKVDSTTLQHALFEASDEIIDKVMNNLSKRATATLREELAYQRPIPPSQQTTARENIGRAIGAIEEELV